MKANHPLPFCAPWLLAAAGLFSFVMVTLAQPALPNINTGNIINITKAPYSAVNDGVITNTTAIQNAINDAAAGGVTNGASGGTVEIPGPGTYLCGSLALQSHVNLQIDSGATLLFLSESKYPDATGSPAYPIAGTNLTDVEISGSGTIDGNGAGWWAANPAHRPYMIYFSKCLRVLIQNVMLQNPAKMHIVFKNGGGNITIQGITINTVYPSPNTDGIDLVGTNCLVQNCIINAGDDNIAIGTSTSSAWCNNILVTNCTFGSGHGISLGSNTQSGVSNLTVINCTFNGTDNGIRMKSDNLTSGGAGEGGLAQNLYYYNIGMTNIKNAPIIIYSYYNTYGDPTTAGITPAVAAATNAAAITSFTPVWRNIVISNLTATAGQPGMIWARTEMPATNIILSKLNITASGSYQNFEIYNAKQVQILDSQFHLSAGANTNFWLFDADVTFSNSTASTSPVSLYGLTSGSYANTLTLYNSLATLSDTNTLGAGPLTMADSLLIISNNFTLYSTTVLNYTLDLNTNRVVVAGNLALGGIINVTNGPGFGLGTNTLLTYSGTLSGSSTLGSTPGSPYTCTLDTSVAGQVNLVVVNTNDFLGTTALLEGPSAGSDSVVLAAIGAWTATANAAWLHVSVANQSGTGSTNVIFSYDANPGATRGGTLTIAGQTLTVT
ncbi:MAG: glycosyl hydrolase family 28 protein, partial [Verrucomicrobiota bacterium]